jgi:hypothetical protein
MRRLLFLFAALVATLAAANFKLYMKDGDYQLVREYKIEGDTLKFYSIDRSEWEELPATLVDLKKTEGERSDRQAVIDKQTRDSAAEDEAARQQRADIRRIPVDPGVYRLENGELRIFKEPESIVHNEKGMNTLKKLAPLPVFSKKATLELKGEHSENVIRGEERPEFYLQLASLEPFAIIEVTPQKGVRVIEKISVDQLTKETVEERKSIPIFQKELAGNGLFRIWPQDPLPKGEYVVMEYTEGKMNQRVWDFRVE